MTPNRQQIIDDFKRFAETMCDISKPIIKNRKRNGKLGESVDRAKSTFKNYKDIKEVLEGLIRVRTRGLNDSELEQELITITEDLTSKWLLKYVDKL